jgi:prophage regulatory protein
MQALFGAGTVRPSTPMWCNAKKPMTCQPPHELYEVYRIRRVSNITGLARSTIYGLIKEGKFPKPMKLSMRAVGWTSASVFQWLAERKIAV